MSNTQTKRTARANAYLVMSEFVRDYGHGDEKVQRAWRVLCETEEAFHEAPDVVTIGISDEGRSPAQRPIPGIVALGASPDP